MATLQMTAAYKAGDVNDSVSSSIANNIIHYCGGCEVVLRCFLFVGALVWLCCRCSNQIQLQIMQ